LDTAERGHGAATQNRPPALSRRLRSQKMEGQLTPAAVSGW